MPTTLKTLLADDEPLILRSMQKTLLRAGYAVETAPDCPTALEVFHTAQVEGEPFNIAILDINMPGLDTAVPTGGGLDLLSRLLLKQPDLPVIMLTAYDDLGKAREAVQRGARAYFVKGREAGLIELIQQILAPHAPAT